MTREIDVPFLVFFFSLKPLFFMLNFFWEKVFFLSLSPYNSIEKAVPPFRLNCSFSIINSFDFNPFSLITPSLALLSMSYVFCSCFYCYCCCVRALFLWKFVSCALATWKSTSGWHTLAPLPYYIFGNMTSKADRSLSLDTQTHSISMRMYNVDRNVTNKHLLGNA